MIEHLYVHIPFCPKVCPYCSFYKDASDRNKTQGFLDAVLRELDLRLEDFEIRPRTIFFGGGTPSALSTTQLTFLLDGLRRRLDLGALEEWTLEMNPATVSLEKARCLRELGINRVSMGVQAWQPWLLEILGRVHTAGQARRSFEILRSAGFTNLNLDLIFGVPTQTQDEWIESLELTMALGPEHISAYCLTYEEDTGFFRRLQRGEFREDEESDAQLFEQTMTTLEEGGYLQYEISNFARPGRECLHNLAYWNAGDYLGLGPSAFSTCGQRRWQNIPDTSEFIRRIEAGNLPVSFTEEVPPEVRTVEQIVFSLRTRAGVPSGLLAPWQDSVARMEEDGLLTRDPGFTRLTRKGRMLADAIGATFV